MVRKKDGSYRYCVDYRRMNSVTIKDAFPVPDVKDALDSLRGAKYFATIDLSSGYRQLGMTQRAKERSAFCTRRGLYQFTRMPCGLSNAPASFSYFSRVLNGHKETTATRGENFSQSSRHSNTLNTTCWATKSSFEQTITVSSGSGLSNDLKEFWQDGLRHWQSLTSRLNIAQDVYTSMPMRFLDKTANSVGERSPPTTGLTNMRERISSSSHCLFTRFSCAPSSQTMPLPSYKQKIPRSEKPTR